MTCLCHSSWEWGIFSLEGTVKLSATRASPQKIYPDQIMSPIQIFNWCTVNVPTFPFLY